LSVVPKHLRDELKFLKNCQVGYFTLSVGAGGAVLAFADNVSCNPSFSSVYLAPLLVIIPCWAVFFDKSTTITRIVAYLRLTEAVKKHGNAGPYEMLGWENSLSLFRKFELKKNFPLKENDTEHDNEFAIGFLKRIGQTFLALIFITTQKFWTLNWWSFFSISLVCLAQAYPSSLDKVWVAALVFTVFIAIYTSWLLGSLTFGPDSYKGRFLLWRHVLSSIDAKNYIDEIFRDNPNYKNFECCQDTKIILFSFSK